MAFGGTRAKDKAVREFREAMVRLNNAALALRDLGEKVYVEVVSNKTNRSYDVIDLAQSRLSDGTKRHEEEGDTTG